VPLAPGQATQTGFGNPASDMVVPLAAGTDTLQALDWSPDGQFLLTGGWDSKASVIQVARQPGTGAPAGAAVKLEQSHGAPVLDVKWHHQGTSAFIAGAAKTAQLWDVASNKLTPVAAVRVARARLHAPRARPCSSCATRSPASSQHDCPVRSVSWIADRGLLVTGGWDKALRFWDLRSPSPAANVTLPERVYAMDCKAPLMVVATADRSLLLFNVGGASPTTPFRTMASPLKFQTRACRVMGSRDGFAIVSVEGRCAVRFADEARDKRPEGGGFAFKCHRKGAEIFPGNAVDWHPVPAFHNCFVTAGGDGSWAVWDKVLLSRPFAMENIGAPVTAMGWSPQGDVLAYASGYDWHRGAAFYNPSTMPTVLRLHHTRSEELVTRPAAPAGR
jgi:mRNA export factor